MIYYFGYRRQGKPQDIPVVDCRGIQNPHHKGQSDESTRQKVRSHPMFEDLVDRALLHLDASGEVAIGCSWGRHRSYAVAQEVAERSGQKMRRL